MRLSSWHLNQNETPWILLIAGILIKLKGIEKQQKSMNSWAYLVNWKENEFWVGKNTMIFSVYLMDFIQYKASWRLYKPCLTSLSTHFLQQLCCFLSAQTQQVNVITKNTSICQNISVQCQHVLKEHMI